MPTASQQLLGATARFLGKAQQAAGARLPDIHLATAALQDVGTPHVMTPECPTLVPELLEAVQLPGSEDLRSVVLALRDAAPTLRWTDSYAHVEGQEALRAGYFVTTLVGDPSREASLTFGTDASVFLTVQAPNILYPPHSHLAPELYCAMAGVAEWKKGDGPFEPKAPGSWMVHSPWTSHAMQTLDEPLVSLAVWTADLDSNAVLDD